MLSYTLINSHSQVRDPGPKGPGVIIADNYMLYICQPMSEKEKGSPLKYWTPSSTLTMPVYKLDF